MLTVLTDHPEYSEPTPFAGPDHPMRRLTRRLALGEAWTLERSARVQGVFDGLAESWSADRVDVTKAAPLYDAIERGGVPTTGQWIELGSGTGAGWIALRSRVERYISCELAAEMLRHAPAPSRRVRADAARLPFADHTAEVVVLINMLLFPVEVARVLDHDGTLLWVNTLGDQTPIHLPADEVAAALPGEWIGTTSRAGTGLWAALRRA